MTKMTKIGCLLVASLLISCTAADDASSITEERWRLAVTVDGVGMNGDVEYKVPAGQGTFERARAAERLAGLRGSGGDHEVTVAISAGDEVIGSVRLSAGDESVPDVLAQAESFVAGVDDGGVDASLICAPVGWCDELPGNCWCICICGCKCIYWE